MTIRPAAALSRQEALEQRFDDTYDRRLLDARSTAEVEAEQHAGMIRFIRDRLASYGAQLTEIQAWPDHNPSKAVWLERTQQIIDEYEVDLKLHATALAALTAPAEMRDAGVPALSIAAE